MKIETLELEIAVASYFNTRKNVIVPNVSWGFQLNYEADLMVLTQRDYLCEVELKVTKSDMKAEKKKRKAHTCIYVKYMYYAFPEELLDTALDVCPEDAGLLLASVTPRGNVKIFLHRKPVARPFKKVPIEKQFQLARLGAMRIWNIKNVLYSMQPKQLKFNFDDECLL